MADITPAPVSSGLSTSEGKLHYLVTIASLILSFLPQTNPVVAIVSQLIALASTINYGWLRINYKTMLENVALDTLRETNAAAGTSKTTAISGGVTVEKTAPNAPAPVAGIASLAGSQPTSARV